MQAQWRAMEETYFSSVDCNSLMLTMLIVLETPKGVAMKQTTIENLAQGIIVSTLNFYYQQYVYIDTEHFRAILRW